MVSWDTRHLKVCFLSSFQGPKNFLLDENNGIKIVGRCMLFVKLVFSFLFCVAFSDSSATI